MSDYVRRMIEMDKLREKGAALSVEDLFWLLSDRGITFMFLCDGKKCAGCSAVVAKKGACTRTKDITHAKNLAGGVALDMTFAEVTGVAEILVPEKDPKSGKFVGFKKKKG